MRFHNRHIDPVSLWSEYVEFPPNLTVDESTTFLPLVQCPNPDHHTDKRHFQINVDKPLVHCFAGCGISGSYEHAIAMIEGSTERMARKSILKHMRVGPVSKKLKRTGEKKDTVADLNYERYIPQAPMEYLLKRGISSASIAQWELGWDADELRIVIPVKDSRQRVKLLIRRAIREKDQPKYLYSDGSERSKELFGACAIDQGMIRSQGIVVVEGSIDTIIQHQNGFPNTVGILGTKISSQQVRMIANLRPKIIYTMFDADGAGVVNTDWVIKYLGSKIPIRVCRYPKGKSDPAVLTAKEAQRVIDRAISVREYRSIISASTRNPKRKEFSFGH